MKKMLFAIALAGIFAMDAGATITTAENGCYQIANYSDLTEFATLVNDGKTKACGQVTADISASGTWTPIENFEGYFDGGNHTISSLSYSYGTGLFKTVNDKGFFGSVKGGAVIKNVKLESVSISGEAYVGGLIGDVLATGDNTQKVVVDNCSVSGTVKGKENVGGLIGNVAGGVTLAVANSYNTASVEQQSYTIQNKSDWGGLVGYVASGATVSLVNCYNTGSAVTNPLVGNSSGTITATDVGCYYTADSHRQVNSILAKNEKILGR